MNNVAITSISVSVTAKMGGPNYSSESDFISWTVSPTNKIPWSADEAALISTQLSKKISDLILIVSCAKNKISEEELKDRATDMKSRFEVFVEAQNMAIQSKNP